MRAFLEARRRKKAITSYVFKLGPALVKRYGYRKEYTVRQIERTVIDLKLNDDEIGWAIGLYRSSESENSISLYSIEQPLLDYLRSELSKILWGYETDFSVQDVLAIAKDVRWKGGRHDNWMANYFGQSGY